MITQQQPYLNTREEAEFRFMGVPTAVRSTSETTNGGFGLVESWSMPPGFASPYHVHHAEDEAFYVIEGQVAFVCDGQWLLARPGTYVFGPREVPHGFKVVGDTPARLLLLCSPAGFERFVLELQQPAGGPPVPPDMAKIAAVAAKYSIDVLGPLPEWPGEAGVVGKTGRQHIDEMREKHVAALNNRDPRAFVALFADDAVQMPPDAPANAGRAAIGAWIEPLMSAFAIRFVLTPAEVQILGDTAIEAGAYSLELTPDGAPNSISQAGKYITVYRRAGSEWLVTRDIWNTDQPFRMENA